MNDRLFLLACLTFLLAFFLAFEQGDPLNSLSVKTQSEIFEQGDPLFTPEPIILIATGDVMLGRYVNVKMAQANDFTLPFRKTADILRSADITFINLENPITDPCPLTSSGMIFCTDKRSIEGLKFAGIDIANLANNHIHNYKQEGIQQTIQFLNQAEIAHTGINGPYYKIVKDTKFAFLGYNDIERLNFDISWAEEEKIDKEVRDAKSNSDIVIVAFHFGNEYQNMPSNRQKQLARLAVDSGADIVIGHHPHWIQPMERYKDKVIIYSHGNFIFDQNWSQETREGLVSKFTYYNKQLIDVEFLPVQINTNGQAVFLESDAKERILTKFKNLNLKLQAAP